MRSLAFLLLGFAWGCSSHAERFDRPLVSQGIEARLAVGLGPAREPGTAAIPPGIRLDDGVSADEAVAVALWNNAAFEEALSGLGLARADLVQAGLLTNPTLSVLFPLGPKQLELAAKLPLEVFWLRGQRLAAAELRCRKAAELLVQGGLDLAREARKAHSEWLTARRRQALSMEVSQAFREVAQIQTARLAAGDASEMEKDLARAEALQAQSDAARARKETALAQARLEALLGVGALQLETQDSVAVIAAPGSIGDLGTLLRDALASRPDVRAAELEIEAAAERAGLARWEAIAIAGILDINGDGKKGFEAGPGLEMTLPIFHQNQGASQRAQAELEQAARRYVTVRDAIALEVRTARESIAEALAAERSWREGVLPALEAAAAAVERAQGAGDATGKDVLEIRIRLLKARGDHATLELSLRRTAADLEHAVGHRLDPPRKYLVLDAE